MSATEGYKDRVIGPRRVGGRYFSADLNREYTVLAIHRDLPSWPDVEIVCQDDDGRIRRHCTPWDDNVDQVIA